MKSMYKKVSSTGSVNIPIAMRRELGIEAHDPMELKVNGEGEIVIRPYVPRCIFCGGQDNIHKISERNICVPCAKKVYEILTKGDSENGRIETEDQSAAGR